MERLFKTFFSIFMICLVFKKIEIMKEKIKSILTAKLLLYCLYISGIHGFKFFLSILEFIKILTQLYRYLK